MCRDRRLESGLSEVPVECAVAGRDAFARSLPAPRRARRTCQGPPDDRGSARSHRRGPARRGCARLDAGRGAAGARTRALSRRRHAHRLRRHGVDPLPRLRGRSRDRDRRTRAHPLRRRPQLGACGTSSGRVLGPEPRRRGDVRDRSDRRARGHVAVRLFHAGGSAGGLDRGGDRRRRRLRPTAELDAAGSPGPSRERRA
jgi:hypothetical protein